MSSRTSLFVISVLGLVLAGASLIDIWMDYGLENKSLWSTLAENALPLLLALSLPIVTWWLSRTYRPHHLSKVARWTVIGFGAALGLVGIVLGAQALQGEFKPRIIALQIASGGAVAGLLVGQTLAEQRRAREEVERQRLFESLKQSVLEGIVIAGGDGKIIDWNRGALEIFGYEKDEVLGRPLESLVPERHGSPLQQRLMRMSPALEQQWKGETFEIEGQRKSGEEFPLELSLSSWKSGGEVYFAAIVRDITERRELQHGVLQIQEEERRRLGQDLHDGVASQLTGATLKLKHLSLKTDEEEVGEEIEEVQTLIQESVNDVRRLSRGLNPSGLSEGNLPSALDELAENTEGVRFEEGPDLPSCRDETATNLYRIAQEAVRNAQKYADAERIDVRLRQENGALLLEVEDNGKGFELDDVDEKGFGIRSIRHRAEVSGAQLTIDSTPGEGTLVRCQVPI